MSIEAMQAVFKADGGLSATDKSVLLVLADKCGEDGRAWPSVQMIADYSGLTRRGVQITLASLEERGFLTKVRRLRENGSHSSNEIYLNLTLLLDSKRKPPEELGGGSEHGARGGAHTEDLGGEHGAPPDSPLNPQLESTVRARGLLDLEIPTKTAESETPQAAFEEFWRRYPRKEAKGTAKKAFERAWTKLAKTSPAAGGRLGVLLRAIDGQGLGRREKQFIPFPATWLNGERWLDEATTGSGPANLPDWT